MSSLAEVAPALAPLCTAFSSFADATTVLKFAPVEDAMSQLAASTGVPDGSLRTLIVLMAAYPLGMVQRRLGSPSVQHLFNIVVGVFMAQFTFGEGWFHSFLSSGIAFAMMHTLPRRAMPWVVFWFMMAYVVAAHAYNLVFHYREWNLDFTGPQMVLTMKITAVAWNVYDGTAGQGEIKKGLENPRKAGVMRARSAVALTGLPSPLEYFSFVYHFSTFMAGPALPIRHFLDTTARKNMVDRDGAPLPAGVMPPGFVRAYATSFAAGLVCLATFMTLSPYYDAQALPTDEIMGRPWHQFILYILVSMFLLRFKYYFAWKMAEGGCIASGYGFAGYDKDGNALWTEANNIEIIGFETATSIRELSRVWNKHTQRWLELYSYHRVSSNKMAYTYFISALWHGLYGGYYLFFLSVILPQTVGKMAFKKLFPFVDARKNGQYAYLHPVYSLTSRILTSLTVNYLVVAFVMLDPALGIKVWNRVGFYGHVWCIFCLIFLSVFPGPAKKVAK